MVKSKRTPFNQAHRELKAQLKDFSGWELPAWYTSIIEEHNACRSGVAMWDVSDMGRLWITGNNARLFLDKVLSKPVSTLKLGQAQLCLMLLENGNIIDDLWVYYVAKNRYYIVWNAADHEKKLDWLKKWAGNDEDIIINDILFNTAMLSVQGPKTTELALVRDFINLPRFGHKYAKIGGIDAYTGRTGYTGEDGFEIIVDSNAAMSLWNMFLKDGVRPGGLGARDILRIEAGLLLSGADFDSSNNPYEAGYMWVVSLDNHDFIGKDALMRIKEESISQKLVAFKVKGREIARAGHKIFNNGKQVGKVTSGCPSLSLGYNIGFGYVQHDLAKMGTEIDIMIRNKPIKAVVTKRKFYIREEK